MTIRNLILCMTVLFLTTSCSFHKPGKIRISENNIINTTGYGDAMAWFDEQERDSVPQTYWITSGITSFWPAELIIDLGRRFKITRISVYDGKIGKHNGSHYEISKGVLTISAGQPFEWKDSLEYALSNEGKWQDLDWNAESRYLRLKKSSTEQYLWQGLGPYNCDLAINEIILEGYPLEKEKPETEVEHRPFFNHGRSVYGHEFIHFNTGQGA